MARLTQEEKRVREAMKSLIELNYIFESGQGKEWAILEHGKFFIFSRRLLKKISHVLNLVIPNFSPCYFYPKLRVFFFRTRMTLIDFSEISYLQYLSKLLAAIRKDIQMNIPLSFLIENVVYESGIQGNLKKRFNFLSFEKNSYCPTVRMKTIGRNLDFVDVDLSSPPSYYETFVVDYNSRGEFDLTFGRPLFDPNYKFKHNQITSPRDGVRIPFFDVVRYIFAKYAFLFGSFDRLKCCQHCSRLFYEIKAGHGKFCSGRCRKAAHDSLEPRAIRLCRERQNRWIRYHVFQAAKDINIKHAYLVAKDECSSCKGPLASGQCPPLKEKNSVAFDRLKPGL